MALWRAARTVATDLAARHPGIRLVRYEELAADPLEGFRRLYGRLDLTWSARAEKRVSRACTAPVHAGDGGFSWNGLSRTAYRPMDSRRALATAANRLSPEEIRRVRELTSC